MSNTTSDAGGETLSNLINRLSGLRPKVTFKSRSRPPSASSDSPRTSDSAQATHCGCKPRLPSKVSREAQVARSARFQEDEVILVREIVDLIALKDREPDVRLGPAGGSAC